MKIEFTDRYKALGIPHPDPKTVCKGQCEGIGYIPNGKGDGLIICPDCKGTGKRKKGRQK